MLIACPNCSTSYMIDPASLGDAGRTVRCARAGRHGSRPRPRWRLLPMGLQRMRSKRPQA
ncbi:MAG: MJ0042-type zinc finger domain-containing protein [Hyphomicrobiales bacterium]